VLLNVSGGPDLTLAEVTEAAETIQAAVDPDANIFFGAVIHPRAQDDVRVTVIATGLKEGSRALPPARRPAAQEPPPPPPPPTRDPEPRPRFSAPEPPPSRDREPYRERPPERDRPAPTEWERNRPRQDQPPSSRPVQPDKDDDWDVPSFLRRPRR
jgi:cell division protein FtsZ